ncbi:16S rRNA (adenine(1518)-N(6)/adenine(1519)-N(6))-dimethyltransferase RsmA [Fulvivirga sedimenti]|uniref:Ribosomal RNA small subunit methyltransferase A n=1 Tax=Fulvivirga sedimenti TaxID=2879465 RepID=A0A9X1KX31_9BACT|nr:16S rRNA (adenine(1518)-N(6)/adenine(1519)-N(6))-dimethyltransferase RsmA [Fulvivirga sedimenti]MCA6073832.1 16S rRNA (adenine(1518)-N(6)/adenine(1519)-N(6))-dimethyltransferase RsmA [Fulvivirga sedimenti]
MVRAKKHLGQHFLKDEQIARRIAFSLSADGLFSQVLEIGPGTGVLTRHLLEQWRGRLTLVELDRESVAYLKKNFDHSDFVLIEGDFLRMDLTSLMQEPFAIIGNFPYNISSQIFFKVLEHRDQVMEVVGMLQKEVAERLVSPPGNRDYGILSVFLQAYYDMEYLFTVEPHVFNPPPKVRSGVIRLRRNSVTSLGCDEILFRQIVKQGFQNRRKTLRNALKPLNLPFDSVPDSTLGARAEQLSVDEFVELTKQLQSWKS